MRNRYTYELLALPIRESTTGEEYLMRPRFTLTTEVMKDGEKVGTYQCFTVDLDVAIQEFKTCLEDGDHPTLREFWASDKSETILRLMDME